MSKGAWVGIVAATVSVLPWPSLRAAAQVNLPPGFELVEVGVDERQTDRPAINDCGQIVYVKGKHENSRVFLYDNGRYSQLTEHDDGRLVLIADINNAGTAVWCRGHYDRYDTFEIVRMQNGVQTVIGPGSGPKINNLGHIAYEKFREFAPCDNGFKNIRSDVMLFDGERSRLIFRSDWTDQSVEINDSDWVTWAHDDMCVDPWWVGLTPLYDGHSVRYLSLNLDQYVDRSINNLGQIVWMLDEEIYRWDNGQTRSLEFGPDVGGPRLNDSGDIFYWRWYDQKRNFDAWIYHAGGEDPGHYRLTDDDINDSVGNINNYGEAVWRTFLDPVHGRWDGGVRYLRRIRIGDSEFDDDIDLADLDALAGCMTGPGRISQGAEDCLCDCRFLDIDHDDDVDLADFARQQNAFTGEN